MMLRQISKTLRGGERGQVAVAMVIGLLVVFAIFGLAFDAGLWYFDHRTAQNQAEAAALAGSGFLPATDTSAATAAIDEWLAKNGSSSDDLCATNPIQYWDRNNSGMSDTVRVCIRRHSKAVFTMIPGIPFAWISAAATATAGRVNMANVMPFGIIPPDPTCTPEAGRNCKADLNGDQDYTDPGECNAPFDQCPWGLNPDRLYAFKEGGGGNTGIIDACGNGATNYRDCITGEHVSGFFEEGETVYTGLQGGSLGQNTANALADRYPSTTWEQCDVASTPDPSNGYDPNGHLLAIAKYVNSTGCEDRLVVVPVIASMPPQGGGSADITTLGVATFAITNWNRVSNKDAYGTTAQACSTSTPDTGSFPCGLVWGYLMKDARPPDFLLQQIGDSNNPFAPIMVGLVE